IHLVLFADGKERVDRNHLSLAKTPTAHFTPAMMLLIGWCIHSGPDREFSPRANEKVLKTTSAIRFPKRPAVYQKQLTDWNCTIQQMYFLYPDRCILPRIFMIVILHGSVLFRAPFRGKKYIMTTRISRKE